MKRRLLQIGAASLLAVAAALAFAPSAQAVCAYVFSPLNGTQMTCPGFGEVSVLVFNRPGAHVHDTILTSTGTTNLRMECTRTGGRQPPDSTYVAYSGLIEGSHDISCSKNIPQISFVRCGDTPDCR